MQTEKAFISVIIAEESPLIARGLKGLLRKFDDIKVTNVVWDFQNLVIVINREKPDFVIINADVVHRFTDRSLKSHLLKDLQTRLVLYHRHDLQPSGSADYDFVFDLNTPLSDLMEQFNALFAQIPLKKSEDSNAVLSERERSILKEIALGRTNKEIGEQLHISPLTVETHRKNITRKLGIKSVSGLTIYAVINGIIDINQGIR